MMSSPTPTAANRSSSRTRKETVRFDPEDDTAAEIRAAAVAAAAAAAAAATANNPTATTMSAAAAVVAKKKRKAAISAAAVPSSSKPAKTAKTKKKTAASSSMARQKNAPWTAAEDQRLRTIVAEEQRQRKGEAIRWTQVAEAHGGSRTAKQARERWLHVVDPGRKQGEWTEEETALVIRLQRELGNRWSKISAQLPGRSSNDVKNKWHGSKRIRRAGITGATAATTTKRRKTTAAAAAAPLAIIATPKKPITPVEVVVVESSTSKMPPTSPLAMSPSLGNTMSPSVNEYCDRDGYYPRDELDENTSPFTATPLAFAGLGYQYVPQTVPSPEPEEPLPELGLPAIETEPLSTEDSIRHPHLFADANSAKPTTIQVDIASAPLALPTISPNAKEASPTPMAEMASPVGNMMSLQNWPGPTTKTSAIPSLADRNTWFGPGTLGGGTPV